MHTLPDEGKRTVQKIAEQSLPNLDKNGGNSYHESRRNLDKTETKIAEQSKVSPKTQSEEDENGVVTVTTPKKTELTIVEQSKVSPNVFFPSLRVTTPITEVMGIYR